MEDKFDLFAKEETGEETAFDLRLSPGALRERGMDFQEFILV
jgi:hypothetical protein